MMIWRTVLIRGRGGDAAANTSVAGFAIAPPSASRSSSSPALILVPHMHKQLNGTRIERLPSAPLSWRVSITPSNLTAENPINTDRVDGDDRQDNDATEEEESQ